MERYKAINFKDLFEIEGIEKSDVSIWLLYKYITRDMANLETCSVRLATSEKRFMSVPDVFPESVCYIVYAAGRFYKKESLVEQAISKVIDVEQILIKEGFEGKLLEEWQYNNDPFGILPRPTSQMMSEIALHETNGFCVFYPTQKRTDQITFRFYVDDRWSDVYGESPEKWQRDVLICYNPNKKQLNKANLDEIFCRIVFANKDEYKQYFMDTLLDEKMCLNEEESMELYTFFENNTQKYYFHGSEKCSATKSGQTEIKDVLFVRESKMEMTEVFVDGNRMKFKVAGFETEKLFKFWLGGGLEKTRLKAALIGILE